MAFQSNDQTAWVAEHLVEEKKDIDLIAEFVSTPKCDVEAVNRVVEAYGERAPIRGHIPCFDVFGLPGCRQDACCLVGTQRMIMETFDDPEWVRTFLSLSAPQRAPGQRLLPVAAESSGRVGVQIRW